MKNETIIVIMNPISHIRIILLLLLLLLASSVVAMATADRVVVTSGRVVYDSFGRVVEVYHPTVAIDTVPPTVTAYDVLDCPVKVTCPDGNVTSSSKKIGTVLLM